MFGLALLLWYFAAALVYRCSFSIAASTNLSFRAHEKWMEYGLILSSGIVIWFAGWLDRYFEKKKTGNKLRLFLGLAGGIVILSAFGRDWAIYSAILTCISIFFAPRPKINSTATNTLFTICCALLVWTAYQHHLILRPDLFEDGPRLASISAFLGGKVPFRDFVVHYGILQEVLKPWISFHIWGVT